MFLGYAIIVTKNTIATYSQSVIPRKYLHEQLRDLIDKKVKEGKINDIGEKGKKTKNTVGRCAEVHLVNEILKLNSITCHNNEENDIDNIRFTFAIRTIRHYKARKKIQQEATAIDVLNNWRQTLKDIKCTYLPCCPNCKAMFKGKSLLKERFI